MDGEDQIPDLAQDEEDKLSTAETLLNDSRISPSGNGDPDGPLVTTTPTSGQKWWAAVLLGFVFFILRSPLVDLLLSKASTSLGGMTLVDGRGPAFVLLIVDTIIFILIVRLILW